jgi:hypothetical protein
MMTWYIVTIWGNKIEPVRVQSATDKTVVLENGKRAHITTSYDQMFPTLGEAVQYVKRRAKGKIAHHTQESERNRDALVALAALYPDEFGVEEGEQQQEVQA